MTPKDFATADAILGTRFSRKLGNEEELGDVRTAVNE